MGRALGQFSVLYKNKNARILLRTAGAAVPPHFTLLRPNQGGCTQSGPSSGSDITGGSRAGLLSQGFLRQYSGRLQRLDSAEASSQRPSFSISVPTIYSSRRSDWCDYTFAGRASQAKKCHHRNKTTCQGKAPDIDRGLEFM